MWYGILGQGNSDEVRLAFSGNPVSIEEVIELNIPNNFFLGQNYPNPFNPATKIEFEIPVISYVSLIIYNFLGKKVRKLVGDRLEAGRHQITWEGRDDYNHQPASGVCFLKLSANKKQSPGEFMQVQKMLLFAISCSD